MIVQVFTELPTRFAGFLCSPFYPLHNASLSFANLNFHFLQKWLGAIAT